MSIESDQHQNFNEQYEQESARLTRPVFTNTNSTESVNSSSPTFQQHQAMMPQQQQQQQQSPHRINMSSQPTTPKPSSATTNSNNNSPHLDHNSVPLPLETQKYALVTPGTPTDNTVTYSPHTNTIRTTAHRKDSIVPNINETCPSFGPTEYNHNVISMDRHSIIDVRLHTKVDRGFFLAEEDWTCYRRNYFQVSGSFSLEGVGILYEGQEFPCLVKDHNGQLEDIHCFMLGVSARLSDCEKSIQLIQHTPKRDKGPQTTPTPKPIRPGGNIGFSAVGSSQSIVTFERLQFKTATANNGKRRAAQQYYVIIVELLAKLRNGNTVTIATTKSSALVVRGRSPGHYAETDSGVTHSIQPRQHRTNNLVQHHPPQQQLPQPQPQPVTPYGRPTAYAGASPNLFQPTEYMPYEYHGVAYTNYGHMPHHQQQQQQGPGHTYPSNNTNVPIMSQQQQQQQQQQYVPAVHDRTNSSNSNEAQTYPNNNNNSQQQQQQQQQEYEHAIKEENGHPHPPHSSSPYYWQRNSSNPNEQHQQQQQQQQQQEHEQEHWSRMRIASNNSSSSVDNSQHGSPYLNHPPPNHHQEHSYYAQQHHHQQQQYGGHSYGHHSHPPNHSLPPPPPPPPPAVSSGPDGQQQQQQHYSGYNYDWQPRPKMSNTYSYESDRRHEYNERQQPQQQQPQQRQQDTPPSTKTTIVK